MKFRNIGGLSRVPFVWYADGEGNLHFIYILKGNTKLIQRHTSSCWGYYYIGPFGKTKYYDFFPKNPTVKFVQSLIHKVKSIFYKFWEPVVKTNLKLLSESETILDEEIINDKNIDYSYRYYLKRRWMPQHQKVIGDREKLTARSCYLCNEEFSKTNKKVIDHNHFSGQYLGIAHDNCNRQRTKPEMVVVFHNANYDLIQLLPKFFKDYGVEVIPKGIPKAGERFMSLFWV